MDGGLSRLEESRREFERQVEEVRERVRGEFGFAPARRRWLIPLAAAAAGFALAFMALRRPTPRRVRSTRSWDA